jgi:aminoglycoside phosphotransferase (APT) family kinase protein
MRTYNAALIKKWSAMAARVMQHHFGKKIKDIEHMPAGRTNAVFKATLGNASYIVRIARSRAKLGDFTKEQWAADKAQKKGIPVPEILEVGADIIPLPYMLQKKVKGEEAKDHPERLKILLELGKYARMIHLIPTKGYGNVFDWSQNQLSKNESWPGYLEMELHVGERLKFLDDQNILPSKKVRHLFSLYKKISRWKIPPALNHCDLRLKNVLVNEAGKIQAIIDWENCLSNVAPYWDFSIALHDLSIDGKNKFLEGYGLNYREFSKHSYALTFFNLVNYIPALERIIRKKQKDRLEMYKLRLNGELDLFSL